MHAVRFACLVAALAASTALPARAAPIALDSLLAGNTSYDGWAELSAGNYSGYGSFPGGSPWPSPIGSNQNAGAFDQNAAGDAVLNRVSGHATGGPYPSTESIYFGGFGSGYGGTLSVSDPTPLANLTNLVLQIELGGGFFNDVPPRLNYNGGSQQQASLTPQFVERYQNGTFTPPGETEPQPVFVETWLFQWNLSGVIDPISSFEIAWDGPQHSQLYALQLDQSDVFSPIALASSGGVPEPGTLALLGFGAVGLWGVTRRRRRA